MKNNVKIHTICLTLALAISILIPSFALAETKAGFVPGGIFYFLDITLEKVGLFFTFDSEKKAYKALKHAEERLSEAQEVARNNKPQEVEKAMTGYEKKILFATEQSKALNDTVKSEELLNTISESTSKHQSILESILETIPIGAREAIENAIEISKRSHEEVQRQVTQLKKEVSELKTEVKSLKDRLKERERGEPETTISPIPAPQVSAPTPTITSWPEIVAPQEPPTISSIQSVANNRGVVDAGSRASIYGTGLSGSLTIRLGNQEPKYVKITGISDTYAEFIVPSYSQTVSLSIHVTNASGLESSSYITTIIVSQ